MWSAGDGAMDDDLLAVERIDQYTSLCISTLSRKTIAEADIGNLGSERGFFVYEVSERPVSGGIHVLAKAASLEAAYRLLDIIRAMRGGVDHQAVGLT
jgi:hypothetical protein